MRRIIGLGLAAVAALLFSAASTWAAGNNVPIPKVSTTKVHFIDVIDAAEGQQAAGSVKFAVRDGDVVRYFSTEAHCAEYVENPGKYPDVETGIRVANMGSDIVALFPKGVNDPAIGMLANGDPNVSFEYNGATFLFANETNRDEFARNPEKYKLPVGGYCLGAMSNGRVVPGDPRFAVFAKHVEAGKLGTWVVFGSEEGADRFTHMTSSQQRNVYWAAIWNYNHLIGPSDKVARK